MRKKVAYYLPNSKCSNTDCRDIENGNPGLGGTEYLIVLVSTILTLRDNIDVILFVEKKGIFHPQLKTKTVCSFDGAYEEACNLNVDFFVFRPLPQYYKSMAFVNNGKTKLVPWCHNFLKYEFLKFFYECHKVPFMVSVGKEQSELYLDMEIDKKMVYIYNCVPIPSKEEFSTLKKTSERPNNVTYIGSIVPSKGFHILAKAWKKVLQEVPDAELYVIGSGKLYFDDTSLGLYSIAQKKYEKKFMKYLVDKNGQILNSVHFCGVLGKEKKDILKNTKVGVPNPSGLTETFGLSAVEMQIMGCNVVTTECAGFLDTVKVGHLYNRNKELAASIIHSLKEPTDDYGNAMEYFRMFFSPQEVASSWEKLFTDAVNYISSIKKGNYENESFRHKKLKIWLRGLKSKYGIVKCFPPVEKIFYCCKKI